MLWLETGFAICATPLLYFLDYALGSVFSAFSWIVNKIRTIRVLRQSFEFEDVFYIFSFSGTRYIKNFSYKFQKLLF
ncbi:hypothetical protein ASU91_11480 [Enterobacter hormaechei subsp. steigerwaltii]|nr:hypothetical protein SS35_14630 [Enterobacter hormaechei subsp. steigerwaltii]KJL79139.1 hypothetical protein SS24_20880 [Enterobacter hormaechei subsp. steigerwaltii]KJL91333.1 hypothetical protein SS61_07375 [Enterobacter hormaechei subsp. steigerwaltii]KJW80488.1 hypothetical protein SG70_18025 [Enterobacter hormaechei subsp. steigerwaltii]KJW84685.1 hypothetical protein SG68_09945 [Enterobacter hormaechei subsp. steigerwaltii]